MYLDANKLIENSAASESASRADLETCSEDEIGKKIWKVDLSPSWFWESADYRIAVQLDLNGSVFGFLLKL